MFKLQFENARGQVVELFDYPFRLTSVEGLGEVGAEIQSQRSPYQDGETYIDSVLEPRYMSINFKIEGIDASDTESKRRLIASIFNPKLGPGTLKYIRGDEIKVISAVTESVPTFPDGNLNRKETFQKALVFLRASDPYWKSPIINEEPMSAFVGLFELPSDEYWEVGEDGDLYFEVGYEGERRELFVKGDAPVPIEITFHGPLLNPTLRNKTTGEMIRVKQRLEEGDELVINTEEKTVLLNGEDVFHWIDINSNYWSLQVGANEVEYFADEGMETADLEIRWQERYVAV